MNPMDTYWSYMFSPCDSLGCRTYPTPWPDNADVDSTTGMFFVGDAREQGNKIASCVAEYASFNGLAPPTVPDARYAGPSLSVWSTAIKIIYSASSGVAGQVSFQPSIEQANAAQRWTCSELPTYLTIDATQARQDNSSAVTHAAWFNTSGYSATAPGPAFQYVARPALECLTDTATDYVSPVHPYASACRNASSVPFASADTDAAALCGRAALAATGTVTATGRCKSTHEGNATTGYRLVTTATYRTWYRTVWIRASVYWVTGTFYYFASSKCIVRIDMEDCTAPVSSTQGFPDWPYSTNAARPVGINLVEPNIVNDFPLEPDAFAALDVEMMYLWRGNDYVRNDMQSKNMLYEALTDNNGDMGFWGTTTAYRYGTPASASSSQVAGLTAGAFFTMMTGTTSLRVLFAPDAYWSTMGRRWTVVPTDSFYLFGIPRVNPPSKNLIGNLGVKDCNHVAVTDPQRDKFQGFSSCLNIDSYFNVGDQNWPVDRSFSDACTRAKQSPSGYYRAEGPCVNGDSVTVCSGQSYKIISHVWNMEYGMSDFWGVLNAYCRWRREFVPCTATYGQPCNCTAVGAPTGFCNATYGNWSTCVPDVSVDQSTVTCATPCSQFRTMPEQVKTFNGTQCTCPSATQRQSCACVICPIDCQVSDWTAVTACSTTCGVGQRTENRTVLTAPNSVGRGCPELTRNVTCENLACNSSCQLTDWVQSSACTPSCVPAGGNVTQVATWSRRVVVPGANCSLLSEDRPCSPQVTCPDSVPSLDFVFNRDCDDGEVPVFISTENRWSCFAPCPVNQDPAVWAQFYPCRDHCVSSDKSTTCANSLFCYYEYVTDRRVAGYSAPVYVSPPSVVCRNYTRLCTAAEMNSLCGKPVAGCLASVNGTGGASYMVNCSADVSVYGLASSYVSVQPCTMNQLRNACYRDPSRCRVFTDSIGTQVQYIDCPWANNTRWTDPIASRTPPQGYTSPFDGTCTTKETIDYCGSDWSSKMYRQLCRRKLQVYNEWASQHTFAYSGSCELDVCPRETRMLCPPGNVFSPLCVMSDVVGVCTRWTSSCPPCALPLDLTTQESRRCSTDEMDLSPCTRCRYMLGSGVIETDCGQALQVTGQSGTVYRPAAIGWNRQFVTPTFYRECTREETLRLCGVGVVYSAEDPVWQWKRCGVVGNPALGSLVPAASPGGCDPQLPLSGVPSSICYSNSSRPEIAICPNSTASYNASVNGAISSARYYSFFNPKKTGYNGSMPLTISQCTDSQWQIARGCARFASECRVVSTYKNTANTGLQSVVEHKCWYTADDDWEWASTINARYCEAVERRFTCIGNTTDLTNCRIVVAPNGTTAQKQVRCPDTNFFTTELKITKPVPCTASEALSYCPGATPGWNLTMNPDSAVCNKINCTYDGQSNTYINCSFIPGSCVSRQCDSTEQVNMCGAFTHRCRVNCPTGAPMAQCVQQSDCTVPGPKTVRRCTSDEWMDTCAPTQNECRVQYDDATMSTGYTKSWSCPARRPGSDASYLTTNSYAVSRIGTWNDTLTQCGNKTLSNCTYSYCEFSWNLKSERCYCDLSTCNCPAAYTGGSGTQPCVQSNYFGLCKNPEAVINQEQLCGQFAYDCTANCTGPWYKPVCSSFNCSCPTNRYAWNGQPCGGMPVPCGKPVRDICGSDFASCKRVTGPSHAFATLSTTVPGDYEFDVGYTDYPLASDYYVCGCADGTESTQNRISFPFAYKSKQGACATAGATNLTLDLCNPAEALATCGAWNASCVKLRGVPNPETCDCTAGGELFSVFVRPSVQRCFNKTSAGFTSVGCNATQYADCDRPKADCLQSCAVSADGNTLTGCQRIDSTCFREINNTFACDYDTALRLCGQAFRAAKGLPDAVLGLYSYSDCHFNGSFRQGRGFYNIDMSSVYCDCAGGPFINQTIHPYVTPKWQNDYGRCSSTVTQVRPCTAAETAANCPQLPSASVLTSTALRALPTADTLRTVDRCLAYANSASFTLVPWSCPLQNVVRPCDAREVYRYCPDELILPNQYPSCMVECKAGGDQDKECRLFGECAVVQKDIDCATVCAQTTGACVSVTAIRQQYEHGVRVVAADDSCRYNCTNATSGAISICTRDQSELFDCDDGSHLGCTYEPLAPNNTGTTVSCRVQSLVDPASPKQCVCLPGLAGMVQPEYNVLPATAVTLSQQSLYVTRSYPPCAGPVRSCTADEVARLLGPGGQSCFVAYLATSPGKERLFNYTCRSNYWWSDVHPFVARGMATSVFQSGDETHARLPYFDRPCGLNYTVALSDSSVYQDTVAVGGCSQGDLTKVSSASVKRFFNDNGTLVYSELIPGTCVCNSSLPVLTDTCLNDTYFRPCTDAEYSDLPYELRTMDCAIETTLWSPYLGEGDSAHQSLVSLSQTQAYPHCAASSYNFTGKYRVATLTGGRGSVICDRLMGDQCTSAYRITADAASVTCYYGDNLSPGVGATVMPCYTREMRYMIDQPAFDPSYFGTSVFCTSMDSELCAIEDGREFYASFASSLRCYMDSTPIPCPGRQALAYRRTVGGTVCETMQGWRCTSQLTTVTSNRLFDVRTCGKFTPTGVMVFIDCVWRVAVVQIGAVLVTAECDDMVSGVYCTTIIQYGVVYDVIIKPGDVVTCFRKYRARPVTSWDCSLKADAVSGGPKTDLALSYPLTLERFVVFRYSSGDLLCDNADIRTHTCKQWIGADGKVRDPLWGWEVQSVFCYQGSILGPPTQIPCVFRYVTDPYDQAQRVCYDFLDPIVCNHVPWYRPASMIHYNQVPGQTQLLRHAGRVDAWLLPTATGGYRIPAEAGPGSPNKETFPDYGTYVMAAVANVGYVACGFDYLEPRWRYDLGLPDYCLPTFRFRDTASNFRFFAIVRSSPVSGSPVPTTNAYAGFMRISTIRWRTAWLPGMAEPFHCDTVVGDICVDPLALPARWQYSYPQGVYTISGRSSFSSNTIPLVGVTCVEQTGPYDVPTSVPCDPVYDVNYKHQVTADSTKHFAYSTVSYRLMTIEGMQILCDRNHTMGEKCVRVGAAAGARDLTINEATAVQCWKSSLTAPPTQIPCRMRLAVYQNWRSDWPTTGSVAFGVLCDTLYGELCADARDVSPYIFSFNRTTTDDPFVFTPLTRKPSRAAVPNYVVSQASHIFYLTSDLATGKIVLEANPALTLVRRAFYTHIGRWVNCDTIDGPLSQPCSDQSLPYTLYDAADVRCAYIVNGSRYDEMPCPGQNSVYDAQGPQACATSRSAVTSTSVVPAAKFTKDACFRKCSWMTGQCSGYKPHQCLDVFRQGSVCSASNTVTGCGPFTSSCRGTCEYVSSSPGSAMLQSCISIDSCACESGPYRKYPGNNNLPCERDYVVNVYGNPSATMPDATCVSFCGGNAVACGIRERRDRQTGALLSKFKSDWCMCAGDGVSPIGSYSGRTTYVGCSTASVSDSCAVKRANCGPYTQFVQRICPEDSRAASDCVSYCTCAPDAGEFFSGVPCSGYKRPCASVAEAKRMCVSDLATACTLMCHKPDNVSYERIGTDESCFLVRDSCTYGTSTTQISSTAVAGSSVDFVPPSSAFCTQAEAVEFCGPGALTCVKQQDTAGSAWQFKSGSCMCDYSNGGYKQSIREWSFPDSFDMGYRYNGLITDDTVARAMKDMGFLMPGDVSLGTSTAKDEVVGDLTDEQCAAAGGDGVVKLIETITYCACVSDITGVVRWTGRTPHYGGYSCPVFSQDRPRPTNAEPDLWNDQDIADHCFERTETKQYGQIRPKTVIAGTGAPEFGWTNNMWFSMDGTNLPANVLDTNFFKPIIRRAPIKLGWQYGCWYTLPQDTVFTFNTCSGQGVGEMALPYTGGARCCVTTNCGMAGQQCTSVLAGGTMSYSMNCEGMLNATLRGTAIGVRSSSAPRGLPFYGEKGEPLGASKDPVDASKDKYPFDNFGSGSNSIYNPYYVWSKYAQDELTVPFAKPTPSVADSPFDQSLNTKVCAPGLVRQRVRLRDRDRKTQCQVGWTNVEYDWAMPLNVNGPVAIPIYQYGPAQEKVPLGSTYIDATVNATSLRITSEIFNPIITRQRVKALKGEMEDKQGTWARLVDYTRTATYFDCFDDRTGKLYIDIVPNSNEEPTNYYRTCAYNYTVAIQGEWSMRSTNVSSVNSTTVQSSATNSTVRMLFCTCMWANGTIRYQGTTPHTSVGFDCAGLYRYDPAKGVPPLFPEEVDLSNDMSIARACHDYVYNVSHGRRIVTQVRYERLQKAISDATYDYTNLVYHGYTDTSYLPWMLGRDCIWNTGSEVFLERGGTSDTARENAYMNEMYPNHTWPDLDKAINVGFNKEYHCKDNPGVSGCFTDDPFVFNPLIYVPRPKGFKYGSWNRAWNSLNNGGPVTYRDCFGPVGVAANGTIINGTVIGVIPIFPPVANAMYDSVGNHFNNSEKSLIVSYYTYDDVACPAGFRTVWWNTTTRPGKADGYVSWENKWSLPLLTDDLPGPVGDGKLIDTWDSAGCDVNTLRLPFFKWRNKCWAPAQTTEFVTAHLKSPASGPGTDNDRKIYGTERRLRSGYQYTYRPDEYACSDTKSCPCRYGVTNGVDCNKINSFQLVDGYIDCYDDRTNRYYVNIYPAYTYSCKNPSAYARLSVPSAGCDVNVQKMHPLGNPACEYTRAYATTGGSYMALRSRVNLTTGLLMNLCVKLSMSSKIDSQNCVKIDSMSACDDPAACGALSLGCRKRTMSLKYTLTNDSPYLMAAVSPSGTINPSFAGSTTQIERECKCIADYTAPWFPDTNGVYSSFISEFAQRTRSLYKVNYNRLPTYTTFMNARPDGSCSSFTVDPSVTRIVRIGTKTWQLLPTDWCLGRGWLPLDSIRGFDINGTCKCIPGFAGTACERLDTNANYSAYTVLLAITGCSVVSQTDIPCGLRDNSNAYLLNDTDFYIQVMPARNFMLTNTSEACGFHGVFNWAKGFCECDVGWNITVGTGKCTTSLCPNGCANGGSCTNSGCACSDPKAWKGRDCTENIQSKCNGGNGCGYPIKGECVVNAITGAGTCSCYTVPGGSIFGASCDQASFTDVSSQQTCINNLGVPFYAGDVSVGIQCKCPAYRTGRLCEFSRCASNPNTGARNAAGRLLDCSGITNATCSRVGPEQWACMIGSSTACEGSNPNTMYGGCACDLQKDRNSTCANPLDPQGSALCSGKGVCNAKWDAAQQVETYGCACSANTTGAYCQLSVCDPPRSVSARLGLVDTCSGSKCLGDTRMCECNTRQQLYVIGDGSPDYTRVGKYCQIKVTDQCVRPNKYATSIICGGNGRCSCLGGTTDPLTGDCNNGTWGCVCNPGASGSFCESNVGCVATDTTCGGNTKGVCDQLVSNGTVCRCLNPSVWNKSSTYEPCTTPSCSMKGTVAAKVAADGASCECLDPLKIWTADQATSCKQTRCPAVAATGEVCGRRYQLDPLVDPGCGLSAGGNTSRCDTAGVKCITTGASSGQCSCDVTRGYQTSSDGVNSICVAACNLTTTREAVPVDQYPPYICSCVPGFWGPTCSQVRCLTTGTYNFATDTCSCKTTWTGDNCEKSVCETQLGLTRLSIDACKCPTDSTGQLCDKKCLNGGHGDTWPNVSCQCATGWEGGNCELTVCRPNGVTLPSGKCSCTAPGNWDPTQNCAGCLEGFDITTSCAASVCKNGGTYDLTAKRCVCPAQWNGDLNCSTCGPGWWGKSCMYNLCSAYNSSYTTAQFNSGSVPLVNYGAPNANGSACSCYDNAHNGTFCRNCTSQWTNAPLCDVTTCENLGNVSATNQTRCDCLPRFSGRRCETYTSPCVTGWPVDIYDQNTSCAGCARFYSGQYCQIWTSPCRYGWPWNLNQDICTCKSGYWGTYCEKGSYPCYNGATYNSTTGVCDCRTDVPGVVYSGGQCDFMTVTGDLFCKNGGGWNVTAGSCSCPQTTWWRGPNCTTWSPPCDGTGTSSVLSNGSCSCRPFFSGELCSNLTNPCAHGSYNSSTYSCVCDTAWTGPFCNLTNNICTPPNGQYNYTRGACDCVRPWNGTLCQTDIFPCMNGGTFNVETDQCDCGNSVITVDGGNITYTHAGPQCEGLTVSGSICLNAAHYNVSTHRCECTGFWTGDYCETYLLPCMNGGVQTPQNSTLSNCRCNSTLFSGVYCQFPVMACQNGGSYNPDTGACVCTDLWSGSTCTFRVEPCADGRSWFPMRCPASGCTLISQGECRCPSGYGGSMCATKQPTPVSVSCLNGGVSNGFNCTCVEPFTGYSCELNKCTYAYKNSYLSCPKNKPTCTCECLPGFGGVDCTTITDAAVSKLPVCQNGGVVNPFSNTCNCTDMNYGGTFCATRLCGDHGHMVQNFQFKSCVCDSGWSTDSSGQCTVQAKKCGLHGATTKPGSPCVCTSPYVTTADLSGCELPCRNRGSFNPLTDACWCPSPYYGSLCQYSTRAISSPTPAAYTASTVTVSQAKSAGAVVSAAVAAPSSSFMCEAGAAGCVSSTTAASVISDAVLRASAAMLANDLAGTSQCTSQWFDPNAPVGSVNLGSIGCGPGGLASTACYCQDVNTPLIPIGSAAEPTTSGGDSPTPTPAPTAAASGATPAWMISLGVVASMLLLFLGWCFLRPCLAKYECCRCLRPSWREEIRMRRELRGDDDDL